MEKRNLPFSRRDLLKGGAFLTLGSHMHLVTLADTAGLVFDVPNATSPATAVQPASPEWMKDLIVYEIATKGFTSPRGPESGTFASLQSKFDYLQDLGITGIWLTGYSLCDPHHFYNIWTQYAVIEPDKFDPTLGTAHEFKKLVDEAHQRGIKVFLDVITHGLMSDSPMIQQHPAWFRGGSWGMTDFDWYGGHTDLDDWWVKIYTDFVTVYGVDGYRLDVNIYRPDLWERIRQNAAAAGHPIVIWEELNAVIPGVTDFSQRENVISNTGNGNSNEILLNDLPGFYDRKFGRAGYYEVEIQYQDDTRVSGNTKGGGQLGVRLAGLSSDKVGRRILEERPTPDGLPDVKIALDGVSQKPIANITVRNDMDEEWQLRSGWTRPLYVEAPESFGPPVVGPKADLHIGTLAWGSSIQLSCHDNGWTGFPLDKNPYVAQGSRSIFGYSFLFSPMIPIFFSGEEFDATFHALPDLSPDLYGGKDAGKGRWLYGAMLDWSELSEHGHKNMFVDVKKMIAIRRRYSETLRMWPGGHEPNLRAVGYQADIGVPVPYIRWSPQNALVICANRNRNQDAHLKLKIALKDTPLDGHGNYLVTDLWSGARATTCTEAQLADFSCSVKQDGSAGGGLSVFKIEAT
ncbi:MAG: alpha-amylase family glycosyl hydrolase [Acidobacteriaceae bacterium]